MDICSYFAVVRRRSLLRRKDVQILLKGHFSSDTAAVQSILKPLHYATTSKMDSRAQRCQKKKSFQVETALKFVLQDSP